jgi:hypothetical protein
VAEIKLPKIKLYDFVNPPSKNWELYRVRTKNPPWNETYPLDIEMWLSYGWDWGQGLGQPGSLQHLKTQRGNIWSTQGEFMGVYYYLRYHIKSWCNQIEQTSLSVLKDKLKWWVNELLLYSDCPPVLHKT